MSYEAELAPLVAWVKAHPGLYITEIEQSIRAVPLPEGDVKDWKPPYDGTRLSRSVPNISHMKWKLRYLELSGSAYQVKRKWYTT